MQIQVTENKSVGELETLLNTVRVFVNRDFGYGYWINEIQLLEILALSDLDEYLREDTFVADIDALTAQRIIDLGATPFAKPNLFQ